MRHPTRLWSIPLLLGLSCQAQQEPGTIEGSEINQIVAAYTANALAKNSTGLDLAVLLVVNESEGHCNLFVSNYYSEVLCSMHPYVTINGRRVYVESKTTQCLASHLTSSQLQRDTCTPLDDAVPLPIYDPITWVYRLQNGQLVRQEI
jgi:hypothetical protein